MKKKISLALKLCHLRTLQPSYQPSFIALAKEKITKNGPVRVIMFLSIYRTGGDVCMMLSQFISTI